MTKNVIENVQEFLTMVRDGHRVYQICNIELLLQKHPPETAIAFLQVLQKDSKKDLKALIKRDKTHPRINALVVMNFRLKMAINTIRNAMQSDMVKEVA